MAGSACAWRQGARAGVVQDAVEQVGAQQRQQAKLDRHVEQHTADRAAQPRELDPNHERDQRPYAQTSRRHAAELVEDALEDRPDHQRGGEEEHPQQAIAHQAPAGEAEQAPHQPPNRHL